MAVGVGIAVGVGALVAEAADAAAVDSAACGEEVPPHPETVTARRAQAPKVPSTHVFNFSPNIQHEPATTG